VDMVGMVVDSTVKLGPPSSVVLVVAQ